ncbi:MAG: hypothetical protein LAN70_11080 [Acidobacteriia bacterium]|nr:hypothetical protein [Terriglobia bacterium]
MRNALVPLLALAISLGAAAQLSAPPPRSPSRTPVAAPPTNLQPATIPDATASLGQLTQIIENTRLDLARLRVDKWKADAASKRQAEANAESVQRNLAAALPAIVQQVRANPGSVGATFKLYRNLNALYDVMSSLTESAGAFGSNEEYRTLANDTSKLDSLRRSLADRVEAMAAFRDNEVAQLQARARPASATAAAAPPKKIVVDDNEPVKKSTKKPAAKKKTTTASEQNPPK